MRAHLGTRQRSLTRGLSAYSSTPGLNGRACGRTLARASATSPRGLSASTHSEGPKEAAALADVLSGLLGGESLKVRIHPHPRQGTIVDGEGFESGASAMGALDRKSNPRRVNPPDPPCGIQPLVTPRPTLRVQPPRALTPLHLLLAPCCLSCTFTGECTVGWWRPRRDR